jgi:membrane associated rhomboid family serine protease
MSDLKFRSSILAAIWLAIAPNIYWFFLMPLLIMWLDSFGNLKYSVTFVSALLLSIISIAGVIFSIYSVYACQIIVKQTGIYGYNFFSNSSFVAWDEIEKIEPYSFLGCKYLRLFFSNSTVPLWIPLFLVKQNLFNQTVIDRTDRNNPLHIALLDLDKLFITVPFHGRAKNKLKIEIKQKQTKIENLLKLNSIPATKNTKTPPWMEEKIFSTPPTADTYGYCTGEKLITCSRLSLIENLKSDKNKLINLVWTPETPHLIPPEEISWLSDSLHAREKNHFQQALQGDLMNCLVWGALFWQNFNGSSAMRQIMLFNWLAIAIIPAIEHSWGLYQSGIKTPQRLAQMSEQNRYATWVKNSDAPWTKLLVGCISLVAIVQAIIFFIPSFDSSIETAGIVKPLIWQGEIWRLLTGTLLHGNIIHFMFNIFALLVFSKLIEVTTHRFYIPLVFLIAALWGSIFSLLFIPDVPSVGASGGIMGLLGFLLILGTKHRHLFPVTHQQMLAKATIYTFLAGFLAREAIDNPAHLGGFLAGVFLGWQLIPDKEFTIPMKQVSLPVKIMAMTSTGIIAIATIFTIYSISVHSLL